MSDYKPLLIGLVGAAGAGKTTVADHLMTRWAWAHVAFADPIVDMISALFYAADVPDGYLTERGLKETPTPLLGVSYRRLAQTLGTEWGRHTLAPDFWVRIAEHHVRTWHSHGTDVVLSDVRFPEEAVLVLRLGGALVRIKRPGVEPLPGAAGQHASEQRHHTMPCHFVIHNQHSRATLESQVDALVDHLRGGQAFPPLQA